MELREPKTHETWYKKWTENIVLAYIGMVFVFMPESFYSWQNDTECMAEGKKSWSLFALSSANMSSPFHTWCHDSLCLVLKFQACHFEFHDLM